MSHVDEKLFIHRSFSFFRWCEIIVGIDAGTTSAFAVIDYSGSVVAVKSKKNWRTADLIFEINSVCTPVVIACDTNPSSNTARMLKACFGAKLFLPSSSLSIYKKQKLTHKLGISVNNSHERDAVAAAKKAFNHYSNKLRQVATRFADPGACRLVLQGVRMSDVPPTKLLST
ncbi:DUF460 domain-containing protein [Candidatus Micrarchaeota archaeon]|nr:DUF460 domain-containing protein [Candidatus Micrarchaeota archaeon]